MAATQNKSNSDRSRHRLEQFAWLREGGYAIPQAAQALGVSVRQAQRYEKLIKKQQEEGDEHE